MIRHEHRTILGPIPDDWEDRSLRSLLTNSLSGDWGEDAAEEMIAVLRSTNFDDSGNLNLSDVARRGFSAVSALAVQVQPGDILVERSGGGPDRPVGRVVQVRSEMPKTGFANFIQCLRPNPNVVVPEFLHWALYQLRCCGQVARIQHQTTQMRNLDLRDYHRVRLPYPNRTEQSRISAVLTGADDLVRTLATQLRMAERVKESLLQTVFVRGLPSAKPRVAITRIGEVPSHWNVCTVRQVLNGIPFNGVSPESRPDPPGTPILNVGCISDGVCTVESISYVDVDRATIEECAARRGDFFVLRGNGMSCSRRTWNLRGQGLAYPFPRRIPSHDPEA